MRLALVILAPVLLAGSVSHAQTAAPPATAAPSTPATSGTPGREASPYAVAMREGITKLGEGQVLAAQLAFQRAVAADATKSEAQYYLGLAQYRNGSQPQAVETFRGALRVAQQTTDLLGEARARFAIAESLENIHGRGRHADAQVAWQELLAFAEQHPDVISPDVPRTHLSARERVTQLEAEYTPVRHRIAEREREAARGAHRR